LAEPPAFVASANDRPPERETPVGFFFSPPDRIERMRTLLGGDSDLDRADMERLMLDVRVPRALRMRDHLLPRLASRDATLRAARALAEWDGCYDGASQGAVVHEVLYAELAFRLFRRRDRMAFSAVWTSRDLIVDGIIATPDQFLAPALHAAIRRADTALRRWKRWDRMHRVRLRHYLAVLPVIGSRFTYGDLAAEGGNGTLNKSGHLPARGRHTASYGASARFVADLADPDSNGVVLLGGQDGWLGSVNFLDQVEAWRRGAFVDLPLQAETARHWPHHTVHQPRETDGT
jgi:penicillin amidase